MMHSPLGFSGAERWANCPGSVALIASLPTEADEADPEYRRAGVAAHAAAAEGLRTGADAWELAGQEWEGYRLAPDDLRSVQLYLDYARERIAVVPAEAGASPIVLVEEQMSAPGIHELAFGTIDLGLVAGVAAEVIDYKHGEGIFVEAEHNWQIMGYAALLLGRFPFIEQFRLTIVQPRCPADGVIRSWDISAEDLRRWIKIDLVPAMARTAQDKEFRPGKWCRFCKAKDALACPALNDTVRTIASSGQLAPKLSDASLGAFPIEAAKIGIKAIEAEITRRRLAGIEVPGWKTVAKKSWRVWKEAAKEALLAALGTKVMTEPELKSPAMVEKLGSAGRELVREYAYSPDNGLTVAPVSDPRKAIEVQKSSETFAFAVDNGKELRLDKGDTGRAGYTRRTRDGRISGETAQLYLRRLAMAEKFDGRFTATSPKILMFPHLHEAVRMKLGNGMESKDASFSASFLIGPDDPDLAAIRRMILTCARDLAPGEYAAAVAAHKASPQGDTAENLLRLLAPKLDFALRPGDVAADARKAKGKDDGEFQRGKFILKASSGEQYPPALGGIENGVGVDYDTFDKLAMSKPKFFFGAEAFFAVNFRHYRVGNNKPGVKAYLSKVFINGKGTKMASGQSAAETFSAYVGQVSAVNPIDDDLAVITLGRPSAGL